MTSCAQIRFLLYPICYQDKKKHYFLCFMFPFVLGLFETKLHEFFLNKSAIIHLNGSQ